MRASEATDPNCRHPIKASRRRRKNGTCWTCMAKTRRGLTYARLMIHGIPSTLDSALVSHREEEVLAGGKHRRIPVIGSHSLQVLAGRRHGQKQLEAVQREPSGGKVRHATLNCAHCSRKPEHRPSVPFVDGHNALADFVVRHPKLLELDCQVIKTCSVCDKCQRPLFQDATDRPN